MVEMDLTGEHLQRYAASISARCAEADLPPFDGAAVARLAEQGLRIAGHRERLSTRFLHVADVLKEFGRPPTGRPAPEAEDEQQ